MENIIKAFTIVCCAALIMCLPINTYAAGNAADYDPSRKGSIQIDIQDMETGLPLEHEADVKIYRVGEPDTTKNFLNFKLTGDFVGSGIDFFDMTLENETTVIDSFISVISENHIAPDFSGNPSNGTVTFGMAEQGVYLVVYDVLLSPGEAGIQLSPFLLSVPMQNPDGTGWLYDIVTYPKYIMTDPQPTPSPTTVPSNPRPTKKPNSPDVTQPSDTPIPASITPTHIPGNITPTPFPYATETSLPIYQTVTQPAPSITPMAAPLLASQPENTPTPDDWAFIDENSPFGSPKLPQTGLNRLPIIIMSVLGCALLLFGLVDWLKNRLKRRGESC
jgi:hypothetical protein